MLEKVVKLDKTNSEDNFMANFEADTGWNWVHWYSWQNKFETKPEKVKQNKEKSELENFANFETEIHTEISFIKTLKSSKWNTEPVTEFEDNEAKVDKTVEFILIITMISNILYWI